MIDNIIMICVLILTIGMTAMVVAICSAVVFALVRLMYRWVFGSRE